MSPLVTCTGPAIISPSPGKYGAKKSRRARVRRFEPLHNPTQESNSVLKGYEVVASNLLTGGKAIDAHLLLCHSPHGNTTPAEIPDETANRSSNMTW